MRVFRQNIVIDGDEYGRRVARHRGYEAAGEQSLTRPPPSTSFNGGAQGGGSVPPGGNLPDPHGSSSALGTPRRLYENTVSVYTREYEDSVEQILKEIDVRRSGRALLRAIVRQLANLDIVPWLGKGSPDSPNAYTSTSNRTAATPKGAPLRDAYGNPGTPQRTGAGAGASATIKFLPYSRASEVEGAALPSSASKQPPGTLPDEILVHELVHALLFLSGKSYGSSVPNQPLYDNQDEFFAILIANVYRSECGREESRLHHYGFESDDIGSGKFLRTWENRYTVRKLRRDLPALFSDLHDVRTGFNPFRRMLAF